MSVICDGSLCVATSIAVLIVVACDHSRYAFIIRRHASNSPIYHRPDECSYNFTKEYKPMKYAVCVTAIFRWRWPFPLIRCDVPRPRSPKCLPWLFPIRVLVRHPAGIPQRWTLWLARSSTQPSSCMYSESSSSIASLIKLIIACKRIEINSEHFEHRGSLIRYCFLVRHF